MSISINTEFHNPDCVRSVSVEPDGVLYIHFVGDAHRCQMMPLAEFDRIAAEVATFRRLNAEAAEQERNAA